MRLGSDTAQARTLLVGSDTAQVVRGAVPGSEQAEVASEAQAWAVESRTCCSPSSPATAKRLPSRSVGQREQLSWVLGVGLPRVWKSASAPLVDAGGRFGGLRHSGRPDHTVVATSVPVRSVVSSVETMNQSSPLLPTSPSMSVSTTVPNAPDIAATRAV